MKTIILTLSTLAFLSTTAFAETKPTVPAKDTNQIFKAASFSKTKHGWEGSCDTGEITTYKDLNGDGEPYRVCRRLNILRDYPDDKIKIYP